MHATPAVGLHMLGAGQRLQAIGRRVSALEQLTRRPQHGSPHHVRDQAAEAAKPRGAPPDPASHRGDKATTQRSSFAHNTSCSMRSLRASLAAEQSQAVVLRGSWHEARRRRDAAARENAALRKELRAMSSAATPAPVSVPARGSANVAGLGAEAVHEAPPELVDIDANLLDPQLEPQAARRR